MAYKMVTKKYEGAIFDNGQITKELMDLLNSRNILIEIQSDIQSPNDSRPVVIGVPHHAAIGQEKIAEEAQERPSDEAAAYYALSVFNYLKSCVPCKLVIAAHSTDHNPNKQNDSPYFNSIFELNPRLLFECHGAGSTRKHDLELSSGIALCSDIRRFGLRFSRRLLDGIVFACQVIPGEKMKSCILYEKGKAEKAGELVFPALGTLSLVMAKCKNIPAFHLEARPSFRFDEANPGRLTQQGEWLGKTIAQMILEYLEFENYAHYIRDIPTMPNR
ncbi:MAG TPA: hypothetical protein PLV15_10690 [Smithella sp.]|nr:hypothetical protein [Smithella sp.]